MRHLLRHAALALIALSGVANAADVVLPQPHLNSSTGVVDFPSGAPAGQWTTARLPTGTSGHYIPLLDAANTWSNPQTFPSILFSGSAPGSPVDNQCWTNGGLYCRISGTVQGPYASATTALPGFRNRLINGDMAIDQRNSGSAQTITAGAALAYTVDRWYAYSTGANVTGQRVANTGNASSPSQYAYQFTGTASVTGINLCQRIAAERSYDLAGGNATLSVNLDDGLLTTVSWSLSYANSTDSFGTVASPTVTAISSGTFTVSSTSGRYSTSISIPSAATTGLQVCLSVGAQTSSTLHVGNVQLEPGSSATTFERRPANIEVSAADRYYWVTAIYGRAWATASGQYFDGTVSFPSPMRATPTVSTVTTGTISNGTFTVVPFSATGTRWEIASTGSGDIFASGYVFAFNAEL